MDAEQVISKILSDAQAEAVKIRRDAEEKQSAEQARLDSQLKEYQKQTEELAKRAGEDKKSHILAAARMDIAKELLAEKRKIMDEVFEKAQKQIENLPDNEYRQIMTRLMVSAVEVGDEEVIVDHNEKRINEGFISEVNRQLGGRGHLKLSGQRQNIGSGFILTRGKIKTNASVPVLLEQARKDLETEVAKELFS
jgi:V/A-type H+-transporting ATPase subunit E